MEAIEGLLGQFGAIHFHLQGWAQGLQPVWGGKVIICKRRRDKELSRQKSGLLERSKKIPTKWSPCLLMPLVTYTEGMPEFLEHQDTLCIRRRGTKLSNIDNQNNQAARKKQIESTRKQQHWKQSSSQEDITFKLVFEAKLIASTRLRKQQSNM